MTPSDSYMGYIAMFAGSYPPSGYMDCDGSLLSIVQNSALFSILGNDYGGDGVTTFAVPDLRPRDANGNPVNFVPDKPRYCICFRGVYPSRN